MLGKGGHAQRHIALTVEPQAPVAGEQLRDEGDCLAPLQARKGYTLRPLFHLLRDTRGVGQLVNLGPQEAPRPRNRDRERKLYGHP